MDVCWHSPGGAVRSDRVTWRFKWGARRELALRAAILGGLTSNWSGQFARYWLWDWAAGAGYVGCRWRSGARSAAGFAAMGCGGFDVSACLAGDHGAVAVRQAATACPPGRTSIREEARKGNGDASVFSRSVHSVLSSGEGFMNGNLRTRLTFRPVRRGRRVLAGTAAVLSLVLGGAIFAASPALAVSSSGLPGIDTAGHTCTDIGDWTSGLAVGEETDLCIELGIYTSSDGISSVVAQVEAICQYPEATPLGPAGTEVACLAVDDGLAAPYTPDIQGSSDVAGSFGCNSQNFPQACTAPRSFFEPIATTSVTDNYEYLVIIPGGPCINNIWAVAFVGTEIFTPDYNSTGRMGYLSSNLGTPHFSVCLSSSGVPEWTQLT